MVSLEYGILTEVFKTNLISQKCSCNAMTENDYNLGNEKNYTNIAGLRRTNFATNSWPCRNQESCNYFDKNNPIITEYIRNIELKSLPPN